MAEEIVSCCTSTRSRSTGPHHPRFPDRARRIPAVWGPKLVPTIPATALNSKHSSSNRPICVRSRVPQANRAKNVISRTNRPRAASMSGPEWSIGTRNPRRSLRSTFPSAERVVRRVASALAIIKPKAASMWEVGWEVSGTKRPWTSLVSITRSAERIVSRVASVSDIIRPKVASTWGAGWGVNGTKNHLTSRRSISTSAPLTVDNRVANVSGIIRLRRSVSPRCRGTTAVRIPIASHDSMISARCMVSNGPRMIVTRSVIRNCALTRRAQAGPASMRTRMRSRALSSRRHFHRRRHRHRRMTASSRHRHCRPVRARSMPQARAWLVTLLLIAFCPPILRGPSSAPIVPLQHRRCPPRSALPPPNGCWPISSQPQVTLRINNATLDHLIACSRDHLRSWEDFRLDFKRGSKVVRSMPKTLAMPLFPRTGYYPPRRYTPRCPRDSLASRKDTWASRPFTIGILDRIHQRQRIMSGIRRWRRPPRGEFSLSRF